MLTYVLSNHCILRLVLNIKNVDKNTVFSMASLLPLNGRIAFSFDTICLTFSTHFFFMLLSHSMRLKYKNSKNTFLWRQH